MQGPLGSFVRIHFGFHPSKGLVYSFDCAIGLWVVRQRPDFGKAQEITQLRYHLPREFGCLVRHQLLREPKHREKLVVKHARRGAHSVVVGDVCLGVAREVIFHDQDIFYDGLFFHAHSNFHRHVVDVYQIQRLRTEDGLQRGYLWFGFEDLALWTASDAHHHSLGHAGPPESLPKQAQCAVPTLVS